MFPFLFRFSLSIEEKVRQHRNGLDAAKPASKIQILQLRACQTGRRSPSTQTGPNGPELDVTVAAKHQLTVKFLGSRSAADV